MKKTTLITEEFIKQQSDKVYVSGEKPKDTLQLLTPFQLGCLLEKRKFIKNDMNKRCEFK